MSRSGYSDDCDGWSLVRWRGAVASATRGSRGQKLLSDLLSALDAMPEKALIADALEVEGSYCALGVLGAARGLDMSKIDVEDREAVAKLFDIAPALAAEIVFENDEAFGYWHNETPEHRWERVRAWVSRKIPKEECP